LELREYIKEKFWTRSYLVLTVGNVLSETIKEIYLRTVEERE